MKKLLAVVFVICMAFVPLSVAVFAETAPIMAEIELTSTFGQGSVVLPIKITSISSADLTVKSVSVLAGGSFGAATETPAGLALPAGGSVTVNVQTTYSGVKTVLHLQIVVNNGTTDLSYTTSMNVSQAVETPVTSSAADGDPQVFLYSYDGSNLQPGRLGVVEIKLQNGSNFVADSLRIKVEATGDAQTYFTPTNSPWETVGALYAFGTCTVRPSIIVNAGTPSGYYQLTCTILAARTNGTPISFTDTLTVFVAEGTAHQAPYIESVTCDPQVVGVDNKAKITVTVTNPDAYELAGMTVAFQPDQSTSGFSLYENYQPVSIGKMAAGAKSTASFSFYVDSSVGNGVYPLAFALSYRSEGYAERTAAVVKANVEIKRSSGSQTTSGVGTPRVIVSGHSINVDKIVSGNTFTLSFTLKNTSDYTDVKNIKAVVSSGATSVGGAIFVVAEGSNSFYIPSIAMGKTQTLTLRLVAGQDVEPGIYPINISLDYESAAGTPYSDSASLSFPVTQLQRLEYSGLTLDGSTATLGNPVYLYFQFINKGKATIYNLSIGVEGEFSLDGGSTYIGNLTAGQSNYFDNTIYPNAAGNQSGAVVFKYENAAGEPQELRYDFTVNVMDNAVVEPGIDDPFVPADNPTTTGLPVWAIIAICVGGAAVVAVAVILIVRKARKNKESADNEED